MACEVHRNPNGSVKSMTFTCDAEGCDVSPTDTEIIAAGGLRNMGWQANGGTHFCPKHNTDKEEAQCSN